MIKNNDKLERFPRKATPVVISLVYTELNSNARNIDT
jgi:hypothetical protein